MNVDSYLELYTTIYGWQFYGALWQLLTAAGLHLLPFIGILVGNIVDAHAQGATGEQAVRRVEADLFLALLVLVVSGPPVISLSASVLHYQTAVGGPVTTGSTGTTYDSAFSAAPNAVDVPIAWYAAMAIASGINRGVMATMPQAGGENLRQLQQRMGLLNIKDQGLRAEAGRFQSECYVPALAILGRDSIPADVMASQGWDGDNLNWIGAPLFLQRPGYYDVLHARDPVPGFTTTAGDVAYVDCKTWWSDPGAGLRARLLVQARADATITAAVSSLIQSGLDATRRDDLLIQKMLQNATMAAWSDNNLSGNHTEDGMGRLGGYITRAASTVSLTVVTFFLNIMLDAVQQALPMIQAFVLFGLYTLLVFVPMLARYDLSVVVIGMVAIFATKFLSVLWYMVQWLDQYLIKALFGGSFLSGDGLSQFFLNPTEFGTKRLVLDLVVTSFYLGLPLIWYAMIGWAGIQVGNAVSAGMRSSVDAFSNMKRKTPA